MSGNGLFPLTEEHEMIRQAARDFAQKEIAPIAAEFDETGEFPMQTIRKMGEMGFMGIEVPERFGGAGGSIFMAALAIEELARVDASAANYVDVHKTLVNKALQRWGRPEQQ